MTLGERLRLFIDDNWETIGEFIFDSRISHGMVYKYINNESSPSSDVLKKLLDLGCNINWLLSGHGEMWNETDAGRTLRDKHSKKTVTADDNRKKKYGK